MADSKVTGHDQSLAQVYRHFEIALLFNLDKVELKSNKTHPVFVHWTWVIMFDRALPVLTFISINFCCVADISIDSLRLDILSLYIFVNSTPVLHMYIWQHTLLAPSSTGCLNLDNLFSKLLIRNLINCVIS